MTGAPGGRLEGEVVILTGAAAGIGRVYSRRLAREGARLALVDVDGPGLEAAAAECAAAGAEAIGLEADVSDPESVRRVVDGTVGRFGRVDALVNNAALFSTLAHRPFEEIPVAEVDRVLAVNVRGPFLLCQAVAPHMRRQSWARTGSPSTRSPPASPSRRPCSRPSPSKPWPDPGSRAA
jgi:3-oxoacyl-[acyl-carrier protein] reductase